MYTTCTTLNSIMVNSLSDVIATHGSSLAAKRVATVLTRTSTSMGSSKFFDIEESLLENDMKTKNANFNASKEFDLDEMECDMGWLNVRERPKWTYPEDATASKEDATAVDKILKKSVIKPGFEQSKYVECEHHGKRKLALKMRREREKTKGPGWFNMRASCTLKKSTPEVKHDLQVLQMRSVLDPKHFYKRNDLPSLSKYFQIGKVVDSPVDYYSGRLTKKERKKTIVDELMADAEFSKYNKRKYKEIIEEKNKLQYKAHKHAKRLKGKRK